MSGMPLGCQINNAYRSVESNRIMFGIDSPFHHPTVEIQGVLSSGLNDVLLEDVFYVNAARLMGWKLGSHCGDGSRGRQKADEDPREQDGNDLSGLLEHVLLPLSQSKK